MLDPFTRAERRIRWGFWIMATLVVAAAVAQVWLIWWLVSWIVNNPEAIGGWFKRLGGG